MSTYRACGKPKKWNDVLHVNNIHINLFEGEGCQGSRANMFVNLKFPTWMVFGCLISCVSACPKIKAAKAGRLRLHPFRLATWIVKRATCIRRRVRFAALVWQTSSAMRTKSSFIVLGLWWSFVCSKVLGSCDVVWPFAIVERCVGLVTKEEMTGYTWTYVSGQTKHRAPLLKVMSHRILMKSIR